MGIGNVDEYARTKIESVTRLIVVAKGAYFTLGLKYNSYLKQFRKAMINVKNVMKKRDELGSPGMSLPEFIPFIATFSPFCTKNPADRLSPTFFQLSISLLGTCFARSSSLN